MNLLIQIETIHRTYSESPKIFVLDQYDIKGIRKSLSSVLKEHPGWVSIICDALPFNQGEDTFLIAPDPNQVMNSAYRGKIVKISQVK